MPKPISIARCSARGAKILALLVVAACSGEIGPDLGAGQRMPGSNPVASDRTAGVPTASGPATTVAGEGPVSPAPAAPTPGSSSSPAATPAAPVAIAGRGILSCPTVPYPGGAPVAPPQLSTPFQKVCGTCHGPYGDGQGKYPSVPGKLDQAAFIALVRKGTENMPAFKSDFVSDAQLASDFAALKSVAGAKMQAGGTHPSFAWSRADLDEKYRAGLQMWRTPDAQGAACANCHSPDAIDLAVIGYPDHTIMRRGLQHLTAPQVLVIVDFVHAQRRRFNIVQPCSPSWRPFAPGGEVLPGATPDARDAAFLAELDRRKLTLLAGRIDDVATASKAMAELAAIDLRKLPTGILLPRWTEDRFNGPEHASPNDYLPPLPSIPREPAAWYGMEDQYIANPTEANVFRLIDGTAKETHDGGYTTTYQKTVLEGPCAFKTGNIMVLLRETKRRTLLLSSHFFRMAALGRDGWYEKPVAPMPDRTTPWNPMMLVGGELVEAPCYFPEGKAELIASMPEGARGEVTERDAKVLTLFDYSDAISHPWMTLGQMFDQTLFSTEGQAENKLFYWSDRNFKELLIHEPFFYVHRVAMQSRYYTELKGTPLYPKGLGFHGRMATHPLLDGARLFQVRLGRPAQPTSSATAAASVRFKMNIERMYLLQQRDLLQRGTAVNSRAQLVTYLTDSRALVSQVIKWRATAAGRAALGWAADAAEDTGALFSDVADLVAKAPLAR